MPDPIAAGRACAVQYLRMSTEHQRYSLENQQLRIADYATAHGYEIIDTYADAGRSGLTLKERQELNRLLRDVTDPAKRFNVILVLDVSRWGRFQDPDQHAAYEFLCRDLGARVEYVSEEFANDGSFAASMMKHMKRVMAAEYSRELSAKVAFAQIQSAIRGHKQGAQASFGMHRVLVDQNGQPRHELADGERKAIASDHVILVPGPPEEREVVRHIFDLFLKGAAIGGIVRHLNYVNAPRSHGAPWTFQKVKTILTGEIYTGVYVFNRSSAKLKTPWVKNPPALWVRVSVCEGMVSQETFQQAQAIMATQRRGKNARYSNEKMLSGLKRLLAEKGRLSAAIINACPFLPDSATYFRRFGGLKQIYELIGYSPVVPQPRETPRSREHPRQTKEELIAQLRRALHEYKYLTKEVIDQSPYTASATAYVHAFGTLAAAYRAIGYEGSRRAPLKGGFYDEDNALRRLKQLFDERGYIDGKMVSKDKSMPSKMWFCKHFGNFAKACAKAGIDHRRRYPKTWRARRQFLEGPEGGQPPVKERVEQLPDEQLLGIVRRLYEENGYINRDLVNATPGMPSIYRILKRYASFAHLCAAAGLPADACIHKPGNRLLS